MIGPVCVKNTDLSHGRIAVLVIFKVILNMLEIPEGHGETQRIIEFFQILFVKILESVKDLNACGLIIYSDQGIGLFKSGLP